MEEKKLDLQELQKVIGGIYGADAPVIICPHCFVFKHKKVELVCDSIYFKYASPEYGYHYTCPECGKEIWKAVEE
ncbi:MAG: hypothetical protein E7185_11190 [Erysipelotrichaceae bacterium]|nr:hypothetical protein [Erysipelotrichaceae bacterium]